MSINPWLGIEAGASPSTRSKELRRSWERFLSDRSAANVRVPIARSWRRSQAAGLEPWGGGLAPQLADVDEAWARWEAHPLAALAPLIEDGLASIAEATDHVVVVTDADGVLLWIRGNTGVRARAADTINFTEGALWSEDGAGTNAVGTALVEDHPVQVFAGEHFSEVVHEWACAAAPIHDPEDGRVLGVIDLTGPMRSAHPHSLGLAVAAANAVESQLRTTLLQRDMALHARFEDRILASGGRRALLSPSGRILVQEPSRWLADDRLEIPPGGGEVVLRDGARAFAERVGHEDAFVLREIDHGHADRRPSAVLHVTALGRDRADVEVGGRSMRLSRRHTEILVLLMMRPAGMSSDELAAELYGDRGRPGSVRVEISRLRAVLGDVIDTEPYRLAIGVESDVGRLRGLLDRGAIRVAAECYEAALLPRSDAPGIVREREALDAWVRQSVMTADDPEAIWAWVQSPPGSDDLPAWKRLLGGLAFHDPRRSLAATQVAALRAQYAG